VRDIFLILLGESFAVWRERGWGKVGLSFQLMVVFITFGHSNGSLKSGMIGRKLLKHNPRMP
jgi:hypothetical protein